MLFSSIPFLYYFLPAVLVLYAAVPARLKNTVLLAASLFFYGWGEPRFLKMMLLSILIGYVLGRLIEAAPNQTYRKFWLFLSISSSILILGYFKYADFFIENFNAVTGMQIPLLRIALPIGISFYTFQLLSYTIDVYRRDTPAQKNPITLAAYVALFPQLIAGPIVRYIDVAAQLNHRTHSLEQTAMGIRRFVFGLSKKVLLANALGELCNLYRSTSQPSILFCWMYASAFMLHIYFDFSGYSDMAIGLGHLFGFHFRENFDHPYTAASITDFWRKWHMSLGSWFRDYVYIPLGGNRVSTPRWLFNIFVVWLLTGFWHGAAWNFILWGLYFAVLLVVEKRWLLKYLNRTHITSHLYVLFFVGISFLLFNSETLGQAFRDIAGLFGGMSNSRLPLFSPESIYYLRSYLAIFIIAAAGATTLPTKLICALRQNHIGQKVLDAAEPLILPLLLLLVTAYLVDGSFNPFLYFRF